MEKSRGGNIMRDTIFKKMRGKPGQSACVLYPPEGYPSETSGLEFGTQTGINRFDFVHLFVSSKAEFEGRIKEALSKRASGGLFWISYPKASGKNKPDINRDSLWDLAVPFGVHPVSQVALDELWSAVRFVDNKPGEDYTRPGK
jgi:hypothetical protein